MGGGKTMEFLFMPSETEDLPNEPISLSQATDYLKDFNTYLQGEIPKTYAFQICLDGESCYKGSVILPVETEFSLYEEIKDQLQALQSEEANQLLRFLTPYFQEKDEKIESPECSVEEKAQQSEKEESIPRNAAKSWMKKGIIGLISLFLVGGLLYWGYYHFFPPTPSLDRLLETQAYLEAGKHYPNKHVAIERQIYNELLDQRSDKKIDQLEAFQETYPTVFGAFDLAMFTHAYNQAITVFEDNRSVFQEENVRLLFVGYAYLKTDQLSQAKQINASIHQIELEKKIYLYEQLTRSIAEKEKELKELEKGGYKNREQAEKVANEKFELQEQLQNL